VRPGRSGALLFASGQGSRRSRNAGEAQRIFSLARAGSLFRRGSRGHVSCPARPSPHPPSSCPCRAASLRPVAEPIASSPPPARVRRPISALQATPPLAACEPAQSSSVPCRLLARRARPPIAATTPRRPRGSGSPPRPPSSPAWRALASAAIHRAANPQRPRLAGRSHCPVLPVCAAAWACALRSSWRTCRSAAGASPRTRRPAPGRARRGRAPPFRRRRPLLLSLISLPLPTPADRAATVRR
jgi:hypothetical protein